MFKKDTPIAHLADQAYEVAARYKNASLAPDHLLYALCRQEEGRDAIENVYEGEVSRILSFLTRSFKDRKSDKPKPSMGEELHRFLAVMIGLDEDEETGEELSDVEPLTVAEILDVMIARCNDFPVLAAALDFGNVVGLEDDDLPLDEDSIEDAFEEEMDASEPDFSVGGVQQAPADPNAAAMLASLRNLSELARQDTLSPVIGRDVEIEALCEALTRHRKPNVMLIGEPGVGKSAIVEGLAQRLLSSPPAMLAGRQVIDVSMTSMMAGTRYRGDFEARMKYMIDFAVRRKAILFIDEAHSLVGANSGSSGGMDPTTILKPYLARGDFSVILASTPSEARGIIKDKALLRRFQKQMIVEPAKEDMLAILSQSRAPYESHHGVSLTREASFEIIALSDTCMPESRFPDKAFDVLDLSALEARRAKSETIESVHVREAIYKMTGVPVGRPRPEAIKLSRSLEANLNKDVLGQSVAMTELSRAVRLSLLGASIRLGCSSAHLFNGPTGVGKTEAAKSLAGRLNVPLVRIDMSEFMEKHSVSGLIGAPAGYVGYHDEGKLIAAAEAHPQMVLLLDEVDKAHPDVFDILLQVIDAGRLTSADGRTVSFRGAHIIMTSNLGARESERSGIGFGATSRGDEAIREAVSMHFRPEFIERLSSVVNFVKLDDEIIRKIIGKALREMCAGFAARGLEVSFTPKVVELVKKEMPAGAMSGRRVQRTIDRCIADPIALAMIENVNAPGFKISVSGGQVNVICLQEELEA